MPIHWARCVVATRSRRSLHRPLGRANRILASLPVGFVLVMVMRWNGRGWAIAPSATVPRAGDNPQGVSCVSATACNAVGQLNPGAYPVPTRSLHWRTALLAERWNGVRWEVQTSHPAGGPASEVLPTSTGASCVSEALCAAVGARSADPGSLTLAESYG